MLHTQHTTSESAPYKRWRRVDGRDGVDRWWIILGKNNAFTKPTCVFWDLHNTLQLPLEESMEDIDVFFMDPTFIDLEVYCLWLKGFSGKRRDHGITQYFKKETCYVLFSLHSHQWLMIKVQINFSPQPGNCLLSCNVNKYKSYKITGIWVFKVHRRISFVFLGWNFWMKRSMMATVSPWGCKSTILASLQAFRMSLLIVFRVK